MDKSDYQDRLEQLEPNETIPDIDHDKEYATILQDFIISPFGRGPLNQDLVELFTTMEVSEVLMAELKSSQSRKS